MDAALAQPGPAASGVTTPPAPGAEEVFVAPTTQEEFDKIVLDRVTRATARFADYDELKKLADAKRAVDDAAKTEAQKQAEALAAALKQVDDLKAHNLRAEVAAAKGVPANHLHGATRAELEASADELLAWRGPTAPKGPAATGQGATGDPKTSGTVSGGDWLREALNHR